MVYLTPDLKGILAAHVEHVEPLQRELGRIIPYLFPHFGGRHRGTQRRNFRKAWASACTATGVPGALRHDFRRTAVRNMERTGVPHYAIVSDADLGAAAVFDC